MENFMRKTLAVLLACSMLVMAQGRFSPKAVSIRKRDINHSQTSVLFENNQVQFELVVPSKASPAARFAGEELSLALSKSLGVEIPVLKEATGKVSFVIRVGDTALAEKNGLDVNSLDRDGYFIKTIGHEVLLIGKDDPKESPVKGKVMSERGTLFAAYDFLETFLGTRFFFPGEIGTVNPRFQKLSLPLIDITERPDFQFRSMYVVNQFGPGHAKWYDDSDGKQGERLAWLRYRLNTQNIPNCHGLSYLGLNNRFAKTHPEYFALRDNGKRHDGSVISHPNDKGGHICFSSEGLKNEIFLDAKAFLTGQSAASRGIIMDDGKSYWSYSRFPKGPFFNIMPNDSCYPCQCPGCKPHFDKGVQEGSNWIWKFKTDIARRMQVEGVPGYATMMAYGPYRPIPECDIPSNVLVMLAVTGPWAEGQKVKQAKDDKLLKDWYAKLNAKTYLWTYITKYSARIPLVPNHTPRAVGSYFKRQAPLIFGAFIEAETDNWIFGALNYYVFSKVMWDKDADVDAIMDDFYLSMFQKAAPEMKEFFDSLERHWLSDILSNVVETNEGPVAVIPSDYDIWSKIYSPAELDRLGALFTKAQNAEKSPEVAARLRFVKQQYYDTMIEARDKFEAKNVNRDSWFTVMKSLPPEDKVTIDGKLDEPVWKDASVLYLLPALGPDSQTVNTRIRLAYDNDFIYYAAECDEPMTKDVIAVERKKDDESIWLDNNVEIFLNTKADRKEYYQIQINSLGFVSDLHKTPGQLDWKWDSGVEVKTSIIPEKMWIAEARIPRKNMAPVTGESIIANFNRSRVIAGQKTLYFTWSHFIKGFNDVENFGTVFLKPQPGLKNILQDSGFAPLITGKRFIGKWFSTPVINRDMEIFRTAGASVMLNENSRTVGQYLTDFKPNSKYKISFYVKTKDVKRGEKHGGGAYVIVRFGNLKYVTFPTNSIEGTMPWKRMEFTFETPEDLGTVEKPYVRLCIGKETQGQAWFDQVEILELK